MDLYSKVQRNFPECKEVPYQTRIVLGKKMIEIASRNGMVVKPCAEGNLLDEFGADCRGCMRLEDYEKAIGQKLQAPKVKGARAECACYLSCDIGVYNTCKHLCRYCYANANREKVLQTSLQHDPNSPFLIGNYQEGDIIHDVKQKSWIDRQIKLL